MLTRLERGYWGDRGNRIPSGSSPEETCHPPGTGWPVRRRCRAFSLVELLVVLTILVVLGSLYSGSNSGKKKRARQVACQDNLRKLYISLQIYSRENDGWFPNAPKATTSEEPLDLLIPKYTADTSILICPGSKDPSLPSGERVGNHRISYAYYSGRRAGSSTQVLATDRQVGTRSKGAGEVAFSTTGKPPANNHGDAGGNLLFTDGEVKSSPAKLTMSLDFPPEVICLNPRP